MSTRRSKIIKESNFDVGDCRLSGFELFVALGFWRVKRVASRCDPMKLREHVDV